MDKAISVLTLTRLEYTEIMDFGVCDPRGRKLGSRVTRSVHTYAPPGDGVVGPTYYHDPGEFFAFLAFATRDGEPFGAYPKPRTFKTLEEREAAVEAYFASAKARALRQFGR